MNQLLDGSAQLYDGLNELLEKSGLLVDGVDQLAEGSVKLQGGVDALSAGASQLKGGAAQLAEGLNMLDANSGALNDGAKQVFDTLLKTAGEQLSAAGVSVPALTVNNYAKVLNGVISSLDKNAVYNSALQQVTAGVNARRGEIESAVTEVVHQQVEQQVAIQVTAQFRENVEKQVRATQEKIIRTAILQKLMPGVTLEQYDAMVEAGEVPQETQDAFEQAVNAKISGVVESVLKSEATQAAIRLTVSQVTKKTMASGEIQAKIDEQTQLQVEKKIAETMASDAIQQKLQEAAEGSKAVIQLKASLDSYNSFYLGLLTYTGGVSSAASGSQQLIAGASALDEGLSTLSDAVGQLNSGVQAMQDKTPALVDGITQLRDGSGSMKDGLNKLMTEGIQKIADLAEEDLQDLTQRLSACVDAAHSYRTFSGASEEQESAVKFIIKTDSIPAEK